MLAKLYGTVPLKTRISDSHVPILSFFLHTHMQMVDSTSQRAVQSMHVDMYFT